MSLNFILTNIRPFLISSEMLMKQKIITSNQTNFKIESWLATASNADFEILMQHF